MRLHPFPHKLLSYVQAITHKNAFPALELVDPLCHAVFLVAHKQTFQDNCGASVLSRQKSFRSC